MADLILTRDSTSGRFACSNPVIAGEKKCGRCEKRFPETAFRKKGGGRTGYQSYCNECSNAATRERRFRNPEKYNAGIASWRERNKEKYVASRSRYSKRIRSSPEGNLNARLRSSVCRSLKTGRKFVGTTEALGYTVVQLMEHIEKQFTSGMSWEKFICGMIHIDHIRPLTEFSFNTTECKDFKLAWALPNLRPLWARENIQKKDKRLFLI